MSIIVNGYGKKPSLILFCGEAPGKTESIQRKPFVGASGKILRSNFLDYGIDLSQFYLTNVVKDYIEGNPDPTPSLISKWSPTLINEINSCQPRLIVAIGRFAAQWFLGDSATMEDCHGIPFKAGALDASRVNRAPKNCIIIPIYHPAYLLRAKDEKSKSLIATQLMYDFQQVYKAYNKIINNQPIEIVEYKYLDSEQHIDVTGADTADILNDEGSNITEIAIDTEGTPDDPWSIQYSFNPGIGYVLRYSQKDFQKGLNALQKLADNLVLFIMHCANTPSGCMYEIIMSRVMKLFLSRATVFDTMYALDKLRFEPKGLKPAAFRLCGIRLDPYETLIGDIGKQKQIAYLENILNYDWPKPETQFILENDGTTRLYKPQRIETTVNGILNDIESGKVNKDGKLTDPKKRWENINKLLRKMVEKELGRLPIGTLNDIPLQDAIKYSARDAIATYFIKQKLIPILDELDLTQLVSDGNKVLPIFELMQYHGMPASRSKFESLREYTQTKYSEFQHELSSKYYNNEPFNPNSPPQVASLLRRRGLKSEKSTPTGAPSTGKKAIEHLRYNDPAIELVFQCREHKHIETAFCENFLETFPENNEGNIVEFHNITSIYKPASTETRRLATEGSADDVSILNIPVRTEIGRMVRDCFIAPDGYLMLAADYSQLELRILADDSKSEFLCNSFINGADIHTLTACEVFGIDIATIESMSEKEKLEFKFNRRLPAKTINFGICYGQGDQGVYEGLRKEGLLWSLEDCHKIRKEILRLFGIDSYIKSAVNEAKYQTKINSSGKSEVVVVNGRKLKKGFVRDRIRFDVDDGETGNVQLGMYRYLPNLYSDEPKLYAEATRHVISHRIQGTAQSLIQNAMRYLKPIIFEMIDSGLKIHWLLQYHDELIFLVEKGIEDLVQSVVIDGMENYNGFKLRVPVIVESAIAESWAKLK